MLRLTSKLPLRSLGRLVSSKALMYKEYGEPEKVLFATERDLGVLQEDEVLVKMCAAPINPSDINTIQGVYPIKPPLPAVGGNEGVGQIVSCGKKVDSLKIGDMVIPTILSAGTWRTHFHVKERDLIRLPRNLPVDQAAVISVNPGTAYRMLSDFCDLHPGDIVLQNGSNSAVGIYVIQIAKLLNLRTVNLFRPRTSEQSTEQVREILKEYGATWAVTEAELTDGSHPLSKEIRAAGPIKLALNCLGGKPAITQLKMLAESGTLVSYGAMTRSPMPVPVGPLIFRDVRLRGFWISGWIRREPRDKRQMMLNQLVDWFADGKLRASPSVSIPLADWKNAIEASTFTDKAPEALKPKLLLTMD